MSEIRYCCEFTRWPTGYCSHARIVEVHMWAHKIGNTQPSCVPGWLTMAGEVPLRVNNIVVTYGSHDGMYLDICINMTIA